MTWAQGDIYGRISVMGDATAWMQQAEQSRKPASRKSGVTAQEQLS
ncbi:MAG: hypothetical protein IIC11_05245 [Proteobacteria bacterium]|nr:hypothetical protein [Pseudomonadota bacterium]